MKNSSSLNTIKIELEAKSENESLARSLISAFASMLNPSISKLTEIRTAVSEAVTNCIIHGYKNNGGKIIISASYDKNNNLTVTVKDFGCGIENIEQAKQPLYSSDTSGERGGMGFSIMESFSDKLTVKSVVGKGTTVKMKIHIEK